VLDGWPIESGDLISARALTFEVVIAAGDRPAQPGRRIAAHITPARRSSTALRKLAIWQPPDYPDVPAPGQRPQAPAVCAAGQASSAQMGHLELMRIPRGSSSARRGTGAVAAASTHSIWPAVAVAGASARGRP
jgi:hypothetical protein